MSRIERALEKALKMRRSMTAIGSSSIGLTTFNKCDPSVFDPGEGGVDTSSIDPHLAAIANPYSVAGEEYRKLRTKILQMTDKDFLNAIMVTSGQSGEGKTITSINLAAAIAHEFDHTVLLIDADLRKPSIHTYLGLTPALGLSDYLQSRAELSDILIKTGIGKLVLLPAGTPPERPAELMSSDRMRHLMRELKFRYRDRYIIIDSSPLLMTADALSLCDYTDGIIFVVQAARTSMKSAAQAMSLLKGYNVLGTVFNDIPKYLSRNLYPYYYHSRFAGTTGAQDTAAAASLAAVEPEAARPVENGDGNNEQSQGNV